MSELKDLFRKLSELYRGHSLTWVQIADIYDKDNDSTKRTEDSLHEKYETIYHLPFVKNAIKEPAPHLSAMMEICSAIRELCGESGANYYETHDCWKEILNAAGCESYLAYIYALTGLANLKPACSKHTKLALTAVSTYILSLTIPGAKGFHVFDDEIIAHCMQIFSLTERIQSPDISGQIAKHQGVEILVHLTTLCDDLKLLLSYVHFKDSKSARDDLMKKLINVLILNHEKGYANMCEYQNN